MLLRKSAKQPIQPRSSPGAPPGTIVADPEACPPVISVLAYGPDESVERKIENPDEVRELVGKFPVTWIHVDGLGDAKIITKLGEIFNLHPLALEDVVEMKQHTKMEQFENNLFIVVRVPVLGGCLVTQQLNIFLGKDYVITFQDRKSGYLEPIRERIRKSVPRTRLVNADYLAYAIIDTAIDSCFPVLEQLGDLLEDVEQEILTHFDTMTLNKTHNIKRDLLTLRRAVWPQRDTINVLLREQTPFITAETRMYLRDCYDHSIQVLDFVETFREVGSELLSLYMSKISNDLNAVMKVLTIIATIFIPLGFIASVYGMNFNTEASPWNMPELHWYLGYPFALSIMGLTAFGLLGYFRWKRWL